MLRTHCSHEGLLCNLMRKMMRVFFLLFHFNGAPVEWNSQGKSKYSGEKPVPVPLCAPQIPHGPTRDRTRASAVRGRRLTAWAMPRPSRFLKDTVVLLLLVGSHAGKHQREPSQDRLTELGGFCLTVSVVAYWLVNCLIFLHDVPSSRPGFLLLLHA
jgi:hypothetical protein